MTSPDSTTSAAAASVVALIPAEKIDSRIYLIRGEKVLLDSDLAELYAVETKALNRAVQRNLGRFPTDFMFQLTDEEFESLRCQIGTSNDGRGELMPPPPKKQREMGFHTKIDALKKRRAKKS